MVKPVQKAEISSFVKGLITEASPLNFPADASRAEENFILNIDGSRSRRLGIDFEDGYAIRDTGMTPATLATAAVSSFKWLNAGNNADNEFVVVQFGNKIDVYDTSKTSISADGYIGTVVLNVGSSTIKFSYSVVDGYLIIAAGTEEIHIIEYTNSSLVYTTTRLQVRDHWGLPDLEGNDLNVRPIFLTNEHLYNLQNQGWGIPRKDKDGNLIDPIDYFSVRNTYSTREKIETFIPDLDPEGNPYPDGDGGISGHWETSIIIKNFGITSYPSNAEVVYTGLQHQPILEGVSYERMFTNLYDEVIGLEVPASKGYFIIDAIRRGSSRMDAFEANKVKFPALTKTLATLPADYTTSGATVVNEYAGRVFYAGFGGEIIGGSEKSPNLASFILFTQLVQNKTDLNKCYQVGDPTSRENSDVVDTDGGYIRISGLKKIYGMVTQDNCMFVIADNGVWKVLGGGDYGFSATNYSTDKISSFGCNNADSIVVVNDQVLFWGEAGIFSISKDQYGDWKVANISETTIQKHFDNIDITDRMNAVGIYDDFDKKVRWMYNQDTDTFNNNIVYELVLNPQIGAFSLTKFYNLDVTTPEVMEYIPSASFVAGDSFDSVVVNDTQVVVGSDNVVLDSVLRTEGLQAIKYVTLHGMVGGNKGYTFSQYKDTTFHDWKSVDGVGVDAKAYVLTGTITASDSSIFKQVPYLILHMLKTENGMEVVDGQTVPANQSSCLVRSQWDWANSFHSGKWSNLFQAYRYRRPYLATSIIDPYDNGFETVVTKNKLRGRGRALSLYFETEEGKDCKILGWNLSLTGNGLA